MGAVPSPTEQPHVARDGLVLAVVLLGLAVVCGLSLPRAAIANPNAIVATGPAPWCLPQQAPAFQFGFADLSQALGPTMGRATECEHGDGSVVYQQTTAGLAVYDWCTNTSTFNAGQDHWTLMSNGLEHWTDRDPPPDLPIVQAPDLRQPCPD